MSKPLREIIEEKGWSLRKLAEVADAGYTTVTNFVKGKTDAGDELLSKLSKALKLPVDEIEKRQPAEDAIHESGVPYRAARRVPVVSWARAGAADFNYSDLAEFIDEYIESDCRDPNAFALIVEGDSMEPKLCQGDRIILLPNTEPNNGDVVVARLSESGGVLLKLYHSSGGKVRLTSYNPAYPALEYSRSDFRFIYPVRESYRRFR